EQGAATFISLPIAQARPHSNTVIALPDGYHDRDQAERLRGHTVWVPRGQFDPLRADEYYWVDLLGCRVYSPHTTRTVLLGGVTHLFEYGAHAVVGIDQRVHDTERT